MPASKSSARNKCHVILPNPNGGGAGLCRYAAAQKPVILLPGVNHANLSNGHMRSDANDLSAEVSLESANLQVASAIADFLLVHRATDE
jgi:hypothetical protein